jgi:hypothetical protein
VSPDTPAALSPFPRKVGLVEVGVSPGVQLPLDLTFTNPNTVPLTLTNLSVVTDHLDTDQNQDVCLGATLTSGCHPPVLRRDRGE